MTIKLVIIAKDATVFTKSCKQITEENLYKKFGISNNNHFEHIHTFKCVNDFEHYIHLFSKKQSKSALSINKMELPPPIDNTPYFGNIGVICTKDLELDYSKIIDYDDKQWTKDYEALFGGFEDINSEDTPSSDTDDDSQTERLPSGYVKDNFVVDSDEDTTSDDDTVDSELDEDEYDSEPDSVG